MTDVKIAIQYTGDNLAEVLEFTGRHPKFDTWFSSFDEFQRFVEEDHNRFKIIYDDGEYQYANPGDWVIKHPNGYTAVVTAEEYGR